MLDETILDLIIAIYAIIGGILYCLVCIKQHRLDPWIIPVLLYGIASLIIFFKNVSEFYRIAGSLLYVIVAFIFVFITFREYYHLITQKQPSVPLALAMVLGVMFSIQIILIILIIVTTVMLFQIYLRKRTPTRMFMFLTVLTILISLITAMLSGFGVIGAWELSYAFTFATISFFFATGMSSFLEIRLVTSETKYHEAFNRAEFYKNLFLHDMSNILQGIISAKNRLNFTEGSNLQSDEIPPLIEAQILRAEKLISNIQKLSEAEEPKVALAPTDLFTPLRSAISFVEQTYNKKNLKIQLLSPDEPLLIYANSLLSDVFENLLLNAVKHNKSKVVEIEVKISEEQIKKEKWIKMQFNDNGVGIPDTRKRILFERNRDIFAEQGMRLGLSIVKAIVNSYGAKVWVEDRVPGDYSKGSNFILLLQEAI